MKAVAVVLALGSAVALSVVGNAIAQGAYGRTWVGYMVAALLGTAISALVVGTFRRSPRMASKGGTPSKSVASNVVAKAHIARGSISDPPTKRGGSRPGFFEAGGFMDERGDYFLVALARLVVLSAIAALGGVLIWVASLAIGDQWFLTVAVVIVLAVAGFGAPSVFVSGGSLATIIVGGSRIERSALGFSLWVVFMVIAMAYAIFLAIYVALFLTGNHLPS